MNVVIDPAVAAATNRDALRRIRIAARRGIACRLTAGHVMIIAADLDAWRGHGLDTLAEQRIRRADADFRGARLTAGECRDIVAGDAPP